MVKKEEVQKALLKLEQKRLKKSKKKVLSKRILKKEVATLNLKDKKIVGYIPVYFKSEFDELKDSLFK